MYEILAREELAENVCRYLVRAPLIAKKWRPGQFVIVRSDEYCERVPLTVVEADLDAGSITLLIQAVGASTRRLCSVPAGGSWLDVAGPLGQPTHIPYSGTIACVAGGVGIAVVLPIARSLKEKGDRIWTFYGARRSDLLLLAGEIESISERYLAATEDGSAGVKGFVTDALRAELEQGHRPDAALTAGPLPMMEAVAELTRPYDIPTLASLNPIMIDGTGMCGGCRVQVGGNIKFACVDGPEFDAHQVDFKALRLRLAMYREEEKIMSEQCRLREVLGASAADQQGAPDSVP